MQPLLQFSERGGALVLVIVHTPLSEVQTRLGKVERIDLGLLFDAQHDRTAWHIEV